MMSYSLPQRPPHRRGGTVPDEPPPPSLPPRPRGPLRPPPKPPSPTLDSDDPDDYVEPTANASGPEDIYDDCSEKDETEEFYDDFDEGKSPPLPPHPAPDEIYDDCNEAEQAEPALPPRPQLSPPQREQDSPGPIVQQLPKKPNRSLPAPPPPQPASKESIYEIDPGLEPQSPPPLSSQSSEPDAYEVDPESSPALPPPPPPKDGRREPARPPPQPRATPAAASQVGFSIDVSQLQGLKGKLRKVNPEEKQPANNAHDPKVYGECPQSVSEVKKKLEEKTDGKPGVSPKPALLPKTGVIKAVNKNNSNSNAVTNGSSSTNALKPPSHAVKPPPAVPQAKPSTPPSSSDVTFLNKANKEKHTNVPLPPVPTPQQQAKPAFKFEHKPEEETAPPDEIYDDATSGDLLDKFDWFHGNIDRAKGESKVKSVGKDGTFLVRVSEKDPLYPYTLVVLHKGHVNNLRIRKRPRDAKFALGDEKPDELAFTDVLAMISHHKNHHVVLLGSNQSQVKLQHTPPK